MLIQYTVIQSCLVNRAQGKHLLILTGYYIKHLRHPQALWIHYTRLNKRARGSCWKPTSQVTVWWRHVPHHVLCISSNFFSYAFCKNISKVGGSEFTSLEIKCYLSQSKQKEISYTVDIMILQGRAKAAITCYYPRYVYIMFCNVILMSSLTSCRGHAACITGTWGSLKWMGSPCAQHLVLSTRGTEWCTPSGREATHTLACKMDRQMTICSLATTTYTSLGN